MYKVVPGYKGVVVGDRKDMIERTVRQSMHTLHTKKTLGFAFYEFNYTILPPKW